MCLTFFKVPLAVPLFPKGSPQQMDQHVLPDATLPSRPMTTLAYDPLRLGLFFPVVSNHGSYTCKANGLPL